MLITTPPLSPDGPKGDPPSSPGTLMTFVTCVPPSDPLSSVCSPAPPLFSNAPSPGTDNSDCESSSSSSSSSSFSSSSSDKLVVDSVRKRKRVDTTQQYATQQCATQQSFELSYWNDQIKQCRQNAPWITHWIYCVEKVIPQLEVFVALWNNRSKPPSSRAARELYISVFQQCPPAMWAADTSQVMNHWLQETVLSRDDPNRSSDPNRGSNPTCDSNRDSDHSSDRSSNPDQLKPSSVCLFALLGLAVRDCHSAVEKALTLVHHHYDVAQQQTSSANPSANPSAADDAAAAAAADNDAMQTESNDHVIKVAIEHALFALALLARLSRNNDLRQSHFAAAQRLVGLLKSIPLVYHLSILTGMVMHNPANLLPYLDLFGTQMNFDWERIFHITSSHYREVCHDKLSNCLFVTGCMVSFRSPFPL